MKTAIKKKPKEIEKEIKLKLIQSIEGLLIKKDASSVKKLKKAIKNAASDIAKKYVKAVKKNEKKKGKILNPVAKQAKISMRPVNSVKAKKNVSASNSRTKLTITKE